MIKILLGLLKPNSGKIILNEKNIINENLFELLRISYVKQDFFLLDSSIRENIVFGRDTKNINQGKLKKSAEIADILDKINLWKKKNTASVGEFGNIFQEAKDKELLLLELFIIAVIYLFSTKQQVIWMKKLKEKFYLIFEQQ